MNNPLSIPSLRPYQTAAIDDTSRAITRLRKELKRAPRVCIVAMVGAGKCVEKNTLVWSSGLKTIEQAWGSDRIASPHGTKEVAGWYDDGLREGVAVHLDNGFVVDATLAHPLMVRRDGGFEGWVRSGEIRPGDYVAVARGQADFGSVRLDADDAYALGLFVADGSIATGTSERLQIDKQRPVVERVSQTLARWGLLAGGRGNVYTRDESPLHAVAYAHAPAFKRMLHERFGLASSYSEHRSVPASVLAATRDGIREFLRGYFDGDGWCDGQVQVATASPLLARQVCAMLTGLGVACGLRVKLTAGMNSHVVSIQDVAAFDREVGITRYGLTKDRNYDRLLGKPRNTNRDVVPGVSALLDDAARRVDGARLKRDPWRNIYEYRNGRQRPSYDALRAMIEAMPECESKTELRRIASENRLWVRVRDVVPSTSHRLDCEVPDGHAFVGNGIVNHNTVIAAEVIRRTLANGKRVLFLAHRKELLDQAYNKLLAFGIPRGQLSMVRAKDPRLVPGAPVTVASMQTLRGKLAMPPADVVFCDEAHHFPNASNQHILSFYPEAVVVGLTATPVFGGRGLKGFFDALVVAAKPSMLLEQGFLCQSEVFTVPEELLPDTAKVKTLSDGDFDPRQLAEACEKWDLVGPVAEHYVRHGGGKLGVCFASSITHARMIEQALRQQGVPAGFVSGSMKVTERDEQFAKLARGDIKVLVNVDIATEGWDAPYVKTLIMARPTASIIVFIQQAGRVLRPFGNERATILDHAGNVQRHGFPDEDIDWGLGEVPRKRVSIKRCPQCWGANRSRATVCEHVDDCGPPPYEWTREENEAIERELIAAEGRLARAQRARPTSDPRMDTWVELCREAIAHEYSERWARLQFQEKWGEFPVDNKYLFPVRPQAKWSDAQRLFRYKQLQQQAIHIKTAKSPREWADDKYETVFGEPPAALLARNEARLQGKTLDETAGSAAIEEVEF